jgi:putative hydrolase of HD superfamily
MKDIANFLFEVGMLKKTPRSGFQFLGSGGESVAEHVSRTIFIGYTLSKLEGDVDELRLLKMCLFHDLPETRTGDMNYVNKRYVAVDEKKAVKDLADTLFFGAEMAAVISEFNEKKSREALLAHDADQLSLILQLKRLNTETAKKLAVEILATDSSEWWFKDKSDWWVNGKN